MIFYNLIVELLAPQFLILLLVEIIGIGMSLVVFRRKISVKVLVISGVIAIVLSGLSIIVGRGKYSGTGYVERFGWPFQYFEINRNASGPFPTWMNFRLIKFLGNNIYWGLAPLLIGLEIVNKKKHKIFTTGILILFGLLTLGFSFINFKFEKDSRLPSLIIGQDILVRKRTAIELAYPSLKDFEKQESFAGREVMIETDGSDSYFAYIVNGSGVPIVKAFCFKVDNEMRVTEIGEFPSPTDSTMRSKGIDPKTCKGR